MRLFVILLLLVTGCVDENVEPGLLGPNYGMVDVPATAQVGHPFVVRVATFGDGCIQFERTDVEMFTDRADVWPFDRFYVGDDGGCTKLLNHYVHDVMVTFDRSGTKTIVIHGSYDRGAERDDYRVVRGIVIE